MLDPKRPIREADIARRGWHGTKVPLAAITLRQDDNLTGGCTLIICHTASPWRAIVLQALGLQGPNGWKTLDPWEQ